MHGINISKKHHLRLLPLPSPSISANLLYGTAAVSLGGQVMKKRFPTADVLTVLTGYMLTDRLIVGALEVICSLLGKAVQEDELHHAWQECHEIILAQLAPQSSKVLIMLEARHLKLSLERQTLQTERERVMNEWLVAQMELYGSEIELECVMDFRLQSEDDVSLLCPRAPN